jgi:hypothetical protein
VPSEEVRTVVAAPTVTPRDGGIRSLADRLRELSGITAREESAAFDYALDRSKDPEKNAELRRAWLYLRAERTRLYADLLGIMEALDRVADRSLLHAERAA